jgi:competence protein ComEA
MSRHSTILLATLVGTLLQFPGLVAHAGPVNVNTADAATLSRELKGIGMKRAEAIVEYRKKFGPFKSADELALVKGIGPSAIQKNRDFIRVDAKATTTVPAARTAARPVSEMRRSPPAKR